MYQVHLGVCFRGIDIIAVYSTALDIIINNKMTAEWSGCV